MIAFDPVVQILPVDVADLIAWVATPIDFGQDLSIIGGFVSDHDQSAYSGVIRPVIPIPSGHPVFT